MRFLSILLPLSLLLCAEMVGAQVLPGLPQPLPPLPPIGGVIEDVRRPLPDTIEGVERLPQRVLQLAEDRIARIEALVRAHPQRIARDAEGNPARAGEVVVMDPDAALVADARAEGFTLIGIERIEGLDIEFARFRTPESESLPSSIEEMRDLAGDREVSADQLYFRSGGASGSDVSAIAVPPVRTGGPDMRIGIVDGGVSDSAGLKGQVLRRGFAQGAPRARDHGTAIASLLVGTDRVRGAAGGATILAADVYGSDPAGGNATAIARALGWLSSRRVPVTVVSLVGPRNPILERVVSAVQRRGMIVVAAAGNDGPAAPPAYPASQDGVIAVTGVDGRGRVLIEAGRVIGLDYAAPGADMLAANADGTAVAVRGTSFAAPLAAARLAHFHRSADARAVRSAIRRIDAEARDLGKRGPDERYGRGLVCGGCRTPAR